jgi:UDP-N-acetylmuramate: L-alanyl-gamma-D-glutamyl-meso-diaminopimelate ligase
MIICILGVCGTFMANIACLAKKLGHDVIGYDAKAYPPMSELLKTAGIDILPVPEAPFVPDDADLILVGNSVRSDGPWPAFLESSSIPHQSAPEWLLAEVLSKKKVIAVAGTHGKTTTTSMVVAILRDAGMDPGYLIGGVCPGLDFPAHIGSSEYFVIEADEYSTAYFDNGPKFMYYNPWIFLLNNLEFDHADLYQDLAAIEAAFAKGVELLPEDGVLVYGQDSPSATQLAGTATAQKKVSFGEHAEWSISQVGESGQRFDVCCCGKTAASISWKLCGHHNQLNALAAIAVTAQIGVDPADAAKSLSTFSGVKRRLEYLGEFSGTHFYDDFAHHPTSILETLEGVRAKIGNEHLVALVHLASNTMRSGEHGQVRMAESLGSADAVVLLADQPTQWDVESMQGLLGYARVARSVEEAADQLKEQLQPGGHLVFMGNRSLKDLQDQLQR